MTTSLYEISTDILEALDSLEVDEETGEIINIDAVENLHGQFDAKAENVACYIKNLVAFVGDLKAEEEALSARRKSAERRVESLKRYLASCMDIAGKTKLDTARARISFRRSTSVVINDEAALPDFYIVETVSTRPDKVAIKTVLQSGMTVPGASLVENKSIQIK